MVREEELQEYQTISTKSIGKNMATSICMHKPHPTNQAILTRDQLYQDFTDGFQEEKEKSNFLEFDLLYKIGLMHTIPESRFDLLSISTSDMAYLRINPKVMAR